MPEPTPLGEFDLIARLVELAEDLGSNAAERGDIVIGSGDDAAVTLPGGATATSVDAMVDGIHFRRGTAPLSVIGRKALTAALSDLAAMGAAPGEAYVQLAIPADLDEAGALELGRGLAAAAAEYGVAVAGGDVVRSPVLALAITVVGHAPSPAEMVARAGARAGDEVVVTGELGGAAAGLVLLDRPELGDAVAPDRRDSLRARHLEPSPRLAAGMALARNGATAMIDLSDGLGADAAHVAAASGVRLAIELERVPVQAGVDEIASAADVDRWDLVAAGGEDYELLATLPAERLSEAAAAVAESGTTLTTIGEVTDGEGVTLRQPGGSVREPSGFDQLRP